jgi:hypothetical protein
MRSFFTLNIFIGEEKAKNKQKECNKKGTHMLKKALMKLMASNFLLRKKEAIITMFSYNSNF